MVMDPLPRSKSPNEPAEASERPDLRVVRAPPEPTPSDEAIVALVLAGDVEPFGVLMRRHNQRLFRVTRAILKHDAEAEDAVQQAYLSAFMHLAQFAGGSRFATWLTRIALNEAHARARRRARRAEVELEAGGEVAMIPRDETPTPEEQSVGRELTRLLEDSIDALPEIYRVVVMLREVQELNTAETAACLGLSEEAVRVRLHRGKALLREAMTARLEAGAPSAFAFLGARCDHIVATVLERLRTTMRSAQH